jgi:ATP adenylyltransferase
MPALRNPTPVAIDGQGSSRQRKYGHLRRDRNLAAWRVKLSLMPVDEIESVLDQSVLSRPQCRFCSALTLGPGARPFSEVPILETDRFVVWPSLGGFIEGWVLILPKEHVLSVAACPREWLDELRGLAATVVRRVESAYGEAAIFEHGPVARATLTGCGIDHAHLHVVPTSVDLIAAGAQFVPLDLHWETIDGLEDLRDLVALRDEPYLYVRQFEVERVAFAPDLPSQYMRQALAGAAQRSRFDWKDDLELVNTRATLERLS